MIRAVSSAIPTFLVTAARVGAEQHTPGFRLVCSSSNARKLLAGHMKKRGIGEYAIEMVLWQIKLEKMPLCVRAMTANCAAPSKPTAM